MTKISSFFRGRAGMCAQNILLPGFRTAMPNALIGYTGFVGGNLLKQAPFEGRFNSKNVEAIAGQTYDLVVCAGAPPEKWKANRNPEADGKAIGRLTAALEQVNAAQVVLISTVDVST